MINPMGKRRIATVALLFFAAGCAATPQISPTSTPPPQEKTVISISGSGMVSSLMENAGESFVAENAEYVLNVLPGSGSSGGAQGVIDSVLDIAAMARPPRQSETDAGLQFENIGGVGVALIVHPELEVSDLTQDQARAVFFGEVTNWSAVGGPDVPIVVYVRDEEDSATAGLRAAVLGDDAFPDSVGGVITSTSDMLTVVEGTPGGIGFTYWPSAITVQDRVKSLNLDGSAPNNPDYPAILQVGAGFAESQAEKVRPFLNWLISADGQAALEELGVIPLRE